MTVKELKEKLASYDMCYDSLDVNVVDTNTGNIFGNIDFSITKYDRFASIDINMGNIEVECPECHETFEVDSEGEVF